MKVFRPLTEVSEITENWIREYNEERPHDSLGDLTPRKFNLIPLLLHEQHEPLTNKHHGKYH